MDAYTINLKYQAVLARFGIMLRIVASNRSDCPVAENTGVFTIHLDPSNFASGVSYEAYVAYYARSILLPRLVLETDRLILRRFQMEDAESFFEFLSDRQSCHDDGGYAPYSEMNAQYFQFVESLSMQETYYAIVLKSTGTPIGTINLWKDDSRAVEAMELGYTIIPSQRRQGYAFEAVSALIQLLQSDLKLDLLLAGVFPDNAVSLHLLKKLGFVQEGILRKALWHCEKGAVDIIHFYRER